MTREVKLRLLLVLIVCGVLFGAYRMGVLEQFTDLGRATATLRGLGGWGYVAFVLAYAIFQPFGVPGTIFILVAPLIWPWPIAFGLSMVGTMAASLVGFSFARFVARDWISRRIPERFRKYDEALAARAFRTVVILRFVFWMPPLLHAFFGVSKVKFSTHAWGSFVGYIVPLFLVSYFGQPLMDAIVNAPLWVWPASISVIVATVGGSYWLRKRAAEELAQAAPRD